MKSILLIVALLAGQSAFACINKGQEMLCAGDLVFKGSTYSQGAILRGINAYGDEATVESIYAGSMHAERVVDLHIARGCVGPVCVGEAVFKGGTYSQGARVRGVNVDQGTVTVESVYAGSMHLEKMEDVYVSNGCIVHVCVGDRVYKGSTYSQGAIVRGINYFTERVTVESVYAGSMFDEDPRDLSGE